MYQVISAIVDFKNVGRYVLLVLLTYTISTLCENSVWKFWKVTKNILGICHETKKLALVQKKGMNY